MRAIDCMVSTPETFGDASLVSSYDDEGEMVVCPCQLLFCSEFIDGNCKTARDKLTVQAIYYTSEVPTSVALYDYISPSTLTICYIPSHVNYCIPFKGKSVNF